MKPHPHGSAQRHSARFALLLPLLLSALVMIAPGPSVRAQASCTSDADCDNGRFCDGQERCDISGGACVPGTPVTCNDSNPCTIDYCDEVTRGCATIATGDDETAKGQDGYCHTLDDNLSLYGNDGLCGTGDDRTGDGVCSAIDNCSFVFNPSQEDDNHNGLGNACEPSPCPGRRGYLTDGSTLWVLDLLTGYPVHMIGGLHQPQGVAVNAGETLAYVTDSGTNSVMQIDLETSAAVSLGSGLLNPSSIKLNRTGSLLYVTEYDPGYLTQVPAYPGSTSVRLVGGLSGPRGLALNPTGTKAYIGEFVGGTLKAVDLGTTGVATIATGLSGPSGVALNPAGTTAYVTEYSSGELSAVNLSNGAVTLIRGGLNSPTDLALDPQGIKAYVTEELGRIDIIDIGTGSLSSIPAPGSGVAGIAVGGDPPVAISMPDLTAGISGANRTVAVSLGDVTGRGVLSADITVQYDAAVLSATNATLGSLASACTLTKNLGSPGTAVLSVFCTNPLSGAGPLVNLTFRIIGAPGTGSRLHFASATLNEGSPAVCRNDGSLYVYVDISGKIRYYRDDSTGTEPSNKAVPGAEVRLFTQDATQGPLQTSITACDGSYLNGGLQPIQTYSVVPRHSDDYGGAIDPFDASLNAQYVVGLINLTYIQRLAADASGNGTLTSFDSAKIAQFSVGLIAQLPVAALRGDWVFVPVPQEEPNQVTITPTLRSTEPGAIVYGPIIESAENQDFFGALFGDVSGNWRPPICSPASAPLAAASAPSSLMAGTSVATVTSTSGRITLPTLTARPGDFIQVPVQTQGVTEAVSFYLDLRFDPLVIALRSVDPGPAASGLALTANPNDPGRARLALYGTSPIGVDGSIAILTFEVVGKVGKKTVLSLPAVTVNEGRIPVTIQEGSVQVRPAHMAR